MFLSKDELPDWEREISVLGGSKFAVTPCVNPEKIEAITLGRTT
jgi:hypothetical protein